MRPIVRRIQWLARRRRKGFLRPRPLRIRLVNVASVSYTPDRATRIWERALETPGRDGRPDVVLACELADVHAAAVAGEAWQVIQKGETGDPDSALGIAIRETRGEVLISKLLPGTDATKEGGGIRRRPILFARLGIDRGTPRAWWPTVKVGHAPPKRAPRARADYLRKFAAAPGMLGAADLNVFRRTVARLTGKRVYSSGVLHVAVPWWIPSTSSQINVGSDHPARDVTLWPSTKETR